jgi:hypothetical protein
VINNNSIGEIHEFAECIVLVVVLRLAKRTIVEYSFFVGRGTECEHWLTRNKFVPWKVVSYFDQTGIILI